MEIRLKKLNIYVYILATMAQISDKPDSKKNQRLCAFRAITPSGNRIDNLDASITCADTKKQYDIALCGVNLHNSDCCKKFAIIISDDDCDVDYRIVFYRGEFASVKDFDSFRVKMLYAMRKDAIRLDKVSKDYAEIRVLYDPNDLYIPFGIKCNSFEMFEYSVPRLTDNANIYDF